eukprot:CCRYP_017491-RB/>CCRYP_017491-RB protein AED:0.04 eAED:0.04 QI:345/1/1/1/0.66/0.5/4/866/1015
MTSSYADSSRALKRYHSSCLSMIYNVVMVTTFILGPPRGSSHIEAFRPSILLSCRSRSEETHTSPLLRYQPRGSQVGQKLIGHNRRLVFVSAAASIVQDATDSANLARGTSDRIHGDFLDHNKFQNSMEKYNIKNVSTLLRGLQPFSASSDGMHKSKQYNKLEGSKEVENSILRLGRKGRTDEAIQLYFAIHSLDRLRTLYKSKIVSLKSKGEIIDAPSLLLEILQNCMEWKEEEDQQQLSQLRQLVEQSQHIRPTTRLLNLAIDACARAYPVRQEMAFHLFHSACIDQKAISPNIFTFGALLASCARNGDVATSLQLLRELESRKYPDVVPNGVIYSTVISACEKRAGDSGRGEKDNIGTKNNMVHLALELLNNATLALSMNADNVKKSGVGGIGVVGFNTAISTMARAAEWKMAVQLLDEMIMHSKTSYFSDDTSSGAPSSHPIFFNSLESSSISYTPSVPLLHVISEGNHPHKRFLVPTPDEVTFGTVLAACERAGQWEELLRIANAAKEYGVVLDGMALTSVLHACQQLGLADEALEYLELMKHLGDKDHEETNGGGNDSSGGGIAERRTNGRMRKGAKQALRGPDGVAYRLAISACSRCPGRWQDGLRLLNEMRESALRTNMTDNAPDVVAYTAAITGCSEAGEYTHAMRLIKTMRDEGIQPNVVTLSSTINACASACAQLAKKKDEGDRSIHLEDIRVPMTNALRLLQVMKAPTSSVKPNIVTYNAAIRACAEGMNLEGAFDLLRQLNEDGLEPTIVTYGSLMTACERVGNIDAASKVFRMVKDQTNGGGIKANEIIYGAAISCCRKAGQPERALLLLRKMISDNLAPNTATFNTVIAALTEGKQSLSPSSMSDFDTSDLLWKKALSVFKIMRSKHAPDGVRPNRQTYNILIKNLAANHQPSYAESLLNIMRKDGFIPDVDLYTLTVRSYERCGNPIKALSLMESMRKVGCDFYEIKVFDEVFKNGLKILNRVAGKRDDRESTLLAVNDEIKFEDECNEDNDQLFNSWR